MKFAVLRSNPPAKPPLDNCPATQVPSTGPQNSGTIHFTFPAPNKTLEPPPTGRQPPPYHLHDPALHPPQPQPARPASQRTNNSSVDASSHPASQPSSHPASQPTDMWSSSSSTIPDDLLSLNDFDGGHSETESEKVVLLKRLQYLVADENEEKKREIERRRACLRVKEEQMGVELQEVEKKNKERMERAIRESRLELHGLKKIQQDEEDRIQEEIDKLELELKSLNSSAALVTSLLRPTATPSPAQDRGYFSGVDIEDDISCCSCHILLRPPHKIYQCTNGDLFCCSCRGKPVCPACGVYLTQTIRNKALEKIAKKHF